MKRLKITGMRQFVCMITFCALASGCKSNDTTKNTPKKENPQIDKQISGAYDLKKEGKNGDALAVFEKLRPVVASFYGKESVEMASLLDDLGSCYLRGGDYRKAKQMYVDAIAIMKQIKQERTRLFASINRRVKTIAAFERLGVVCQEPLEPTTKSYSHMSDAGNTKLPYFPKLEDLHRAFWAIRKDMDGCVSHLSQSIPIWTVVTGDGQIALVSVKSDNINDKQRQCLEEKLKKGAVRHQDKMPRFSACFRNFTYPVVFR